MDLPHLPSAPRAQKLYIPSERPVVPLQSTDFLPTEGISDLPPPDVDENTAYSNIQKINQFARYVWIACLRVNEDEDWLDAVLALATSFERLCDGTIFARCGPS